MTHCFDHYVDNAGVYRGPPVWSEEIYIENFSKLVSLGTLEVIRAPSSFRFCTNLKDLGSLTVISADLNLEGCRSLLSLGNLKRAGGSLELRRCPNLKDLGELEYVGNYLSIRWGTPIKRLGNQLKTVKGELLLKSLEPLMGNKKLSFTRVLVCPGENDFTSAPHFISYRVFQQMIKEIRSTSLDKLAGMLHTVEVAYRPFIEDRLKNG